MLEDAEALFNSYTQDAEVVRFLTWKPHASPTDTRQFLEWCQSQWAKGTNFPFVLETRSGVSEPFGMIGLRVREHRAEFGYVLARAHWGQGFMPEALTALVEWSLAQPQIWRAYAHCDAENLASARVMEKAGLRYEGLLQRYLIHPNISSTPRDGKLYAKVKA